MTLAWSGDMEADTNVQLASACNCEFRLERTFDPSKSQGNSVATVNGTKRWDS